jgi:two-component system, NarL family, nitrate/nitrite response regulator NarL
MQILLVDDHSLFRESLSRLLEAEAGFRMAGDCSSVAEALAILKTTPVDVILLDYDLGEEQGLALLDECRRFDFHGKILMLTAGMSEAGTLRALESGASGVFLKHSSPDQLIKALNAVINGEMWLDSGAVRSLVSDATGRSQEHRSSWSLTTRERQVLKGVFEGFSNKEIAAQLQISESSVKAAMQQLFDKTGVRTRSQLVRIAIEKHAQDWLSSDPAR